jgi:hydroxypyruvate reductase
MTVMAYDPFVEHPDIVPFDTLLGASDVISLHIPLTEGTANLIDAVAFAKMKRGVFLIQASRGGTVDEAALYEALINGTVAGAGLDVYSAEPPQGTLLEKLVGLPQVIATPHIGAATEEAQARVGGEVVKLAKAYFA